MEEDERRDRWLEKKYLNGTLQRHCRPYSPIYFLYSRESIAHVTLKESSKCFSVFHVPETSFPSPPTSWSSAASLSRTVNTLLLEPEAVEAPSAPVLGDMVALLLFEHFYYL